MGHAALGLGTAVAARGASDMHGLRSAACVVGRILRMLRFPKHLTRTCFEPQMLLDDAKYAALYARSKWNQSLRAPPKIAFVSQPGSRSGGCSVAG